MSTLVLPSKPAARSSASTRERLPAGLLALGGGVLAMVGAAAPWLSFFAGLQPISGLDGMHGQVAAVLGGASVATGVLFLTTGRPALRWVMGLLGFALLALAGWFGINLVSTLSELRADPLLVVGVGPGLPVLAAGGALAFATLFLPSPGAARSAASVSEPALRSVVVATLALAGIIHLAVGPEHLADSALVGGTMIAAGGAQLALAVLVRARTAAWPLVLAVVLQVALAAAYLAAITVGLPVDAAPHAEEAAAAGHGALGHTEAVTPIGIAALGFELVGAAIAAGIVAMRLRARRTGSSR